MKLADEQLLAQFRQWLQEARSAADESVGGENLDAPPEPASFGPGLYNLAEEFTALRHEIKLQTRGTRNLEDESQRLLEGLRQAIEALRSIGPREAQAALAAGKGLATALAEIDEALDRGRQNLERTALRIDELDDTLQEDLDAAFMRQSWWQRVWSRSFYLQASELVENRAASKQRRAALEAVVEGYGLIQQRLARLLSAEGIFRIAAVGQRVDPEQMIVLEVVPGDTTGMVIEEIRRGYTWNGRLLRCAEVRATKEE